MPQRGRYQGTAGDTALDPTFLEKAAIEEVFRDAVPGQDGGDAAADALVERSPGDIEFGAFAGFEVDGGSGRSGGLASEIGCYLDVGPRHVGFYWTVRQQPGSI